MFFEGLTGDETWGFMAVDDIKIVPEACSPPVACTFDGEDLCLWTQDISDRANWLLYNKLDGLNDLSNCKSDKPVFSLLSLMHFLSLPLQELLTQQKHVFFSSFSLFFYLIFLFSIYQPCYFSFSHCFCLSFYFLSKSGGWGREGYVSMGFLGLGCDS